MSRPSWFTFSLSDLCRRMGVISLQEMEQNSLALWRVQYAYCREEREESESRAATRPMGRDGSAGDSRYCPSPQIPAPSLQSSFPIDHHGYLDVEMSYSREERSPSPSRSRSRSRSPPRGPRSRSRSRSRGRSRSRSRDSEDAGNPGNNLYVTGLSPRVATSDLEKYFNREGKVLECHLVTDPRTKESRGFAFITMETVEDADSCIKYLNRSVLEGRLITVQKAKRKRGRTPTPGRYHGLKDQRGHGHGHEQGSRRSCSYYPRRWQERDHWRDRRERSRSPCGRRGEEYDSHKRRRDRSLSAVFSLKILLRSWRPLPLTPNLSFSPQRRKVSCLNLSFVYRASELPQRQSPRGPPSARASSSDSDHHHRPVVDRSQKVGISERRSPRGSQPDSLQQKKLGTRIADLESQLGHTQEELKKLKDQLDSAEAARREAKAELEKKAQKPIVLETRKEDQPPLSPEEIHESSSNEKNLCNPDDQSTDVFEVPVETKSEPVRIESTQINKKHTKN
ncbi:hypothetical protein NE237_027673 [Protea cynaroides]|uniref:RRM domain-containing protein n=1 Tax=Protea cynaroides TaxID=273540 RepID=A0A9Q0GMY9_9MAGN|nr:hypothetical protein NE237_027673 [Protea cynaroides]